MTLTLKLNGQPDVPLEAEALRPDALAGKSETEIAAVELQHGNEKAALGDFFSISGTADGELRVEGDLSRVKLAGAGMAAGRLVIVGNAGLHTGAAMTGGELLIEGDAGDWLGAEMSGGRIVVKGNAGHTVGSAYRGSRIGVRGGEIVVHGSAGNEVGSGLRTGMIAIGGDCGDFAGVNMLSGSIVVFGQLGIRNGAGMKRGTIVGMKPTEVLPTFTYDCTYRPSFMRLLLLHLRGRGLPVTEQQIEGRYQRWSGDSVELNRGEVLLLAD